jgi:hypothetical protein
MKSNSSCLQIQSAIVEFTDGYVEVKNIFTQQTEILQKCCKNNFVAQLIHSPVDDCFTSILKKQPSSFQTVFLLSRESL